MIDEKRVIAAIRVDLWLPDSVADEEIIRKVGGSFTWARVQLSLAIGDLKKELKKALGFSTQ